MEPRSPTLVHVSSTKGEASSHSEAQPLKASSVSSKSSMKCEATSPSEAQPLKASSVSFKSSMKSEATSPSEAQTLKTSSLSSVTSSSPPPRPSRDISSFKISDDDKHLGARKNTYDQMIHPDSQTAADNHEYIPIIPQNCSPSDICRRLESIETTQTAIQTELGQIRSDLTKQIQDMQAHVTNLFQESLTSLHTSMDNISFLFKETSDHLGQHVFEVRRDLALSARKQQTSPASTATTQGNIHVFEWDFGSVDNLLKSQKRCCSQPFPLPNLKYQFRAETSLFKEGRVQLALIGEQVHVSLGSGKPRFECTAHIVDRSGLHREWTLGRVVDDLNCRSKWIVGDISASEAKTRGYSPRDDNLYLRFLLEIRQQT